MSSILEMPVLVLEEVIGFLDFQAVLTLRKVCRDFRNFIDNLNDSQLPDSKFVDIVLNYDFDHTKIELNFGDLMDWMEDTYYQIEYSEAENSRSSNNGKTEILENSNVVDAVIQDLELILKFQKSVLNDLWFIFNDSKLPNDSILHTLPSKLINMLSVSGRKIKTRDYTTKTSYKYQILSLLPFADPETLNSLTIYGMREYQEIELDEIVKTEQWKQAEELRCSFFMLNLKVEHICHFSRVSISTNSITAKELDSFKKAIISSSKFERWTFEWNHFNEKEELSNTWGPGFHPGYLHYWYFQMKRSEDYNEK